jgi:hypothetical protein
MVYHKKGYPRIRRSVDDMWHWGQHMGFLALTGNDAKAIKLLQTHLPDVEASHDPSSTLAFWRNAVVALECIAQRKEKLKLRLPAQSALLSGNGEYVVADLARKVRACAVELTKRFDRRNGNNYQSGLLEQLDELKKWEVRVPVN